MRERQELVVPEIGKPWLLQKPLPPSSPARSSVCPGEGAFVLFPTIITMAFFSPFRVYCHTVNSLNETFFMAASVHTKDKPDSANSIVPANNTENYSEQ